MNKLPLNPVLYTSTYCCQQLVLDKRTNFVNQLYYGHVVVGHRGPCTLTALQQSEEDNAQGHSLLAGAILDSQGQSSCSCSHL